MNTHTPCTRTRHGKHISCGDGWCRRLLRRLKLNQTWADKTTRDVLHVWSFVPFLRSLSCVIPGISSSQQFGNKTSIIVLPSSGIKATGTYSGLGYISLVSAVVYSPRSRCVHNHSRLRFQNVFPTMFPTDFPTIFPTDSPNMLPTCCRPGTVFRSVPSHQDIL